MNTYHFLDIPAERAHDPQCRYALLPVPHERTVSFGGGTAAAPEAILRASHEVEDFDDELREPVNVDIRTLPPVDCADPDEEQVMRAIHDAAAPLFQQNKFVLSLGGEHSITAPLVMAAHRQHPDLGVLQFDAHLDLRAAYMGSPRSHASVMRLIRNAGIPCAQAGIRSCSQEEHDYLLRHESCVLWGRDMPPASAQDQISRILEALPRKIYITLDMDVMDPALVPGTGTPEPGGLQWFHMLTLLRAIIQKRTLIGADIVEIAPIPGTQVSEYTAARLGAKLLMYHMHEGRRAVV